MTREEAIERIRQRINAVWCIGGEDKEALETLIPELAGSEDERIRKAIIGLIEELQRSDKYFAGVELTDMITYLEKQKEPIPIPNKFSGLKSLMLQYLQSAANRKNDAEIESDTDLFGRKILDYVWKYDGTQKEQKPIVEYDKETETQKAFREGQWAGRQEVFDNPGAYGLEKIDNVFGFRIGDKVRLVDGDGRPHIIKYFEKIEGLHGPDFYRAIFEDNTASDHIIPGDEYPNGYFTCMEKIDEIDKKLK